jgi:hypothetical protein
MGVREGRSRRTLSLKWRVFWHMAGIAVPEPLQRALTEVLMRGLEAAGATEVIIRPDVDHTETPSVMVTVKHRLVERPIEVTELIDAEREARDLAWAQGERRFVYIDHDYDEIPRESCAPAMASSGPQVADLPRGSQAPVRVGRNWDFPEAD